MRRAVLAVVLLTACEGAETGGGEPAATASSGASETSSSGADALEPCGEIVCEHHPGHLCNTSVAPGSPFIRAAAPECDGAYTCVCPVGQTCQGSVCGLGEETKGSSASTGGAGGGGGPHGSGGFGGGGSGGKAAEWSTDGEATTLRPRACRAAAVAVLIAAAGCSRVATTEQDRGAAERQAARRIEPRSERQLELPSIESATETCHLRVDRWDARAPGCAVTLTRCGVGARRTACTSDEIRRIRCGEIDALCGEAVACDCPAGPARPIDDPPGTMRLRAAATAEAWSGGSCRATPVIGDAETCAFDVETCSGGSA